MPGLGMKGRLQAAGAQARDQSLDQGQIHAADDVAMLGGQVVERAVAQPDGAVFVLERLEAVAAQGILDGVAGSFPGEVGGPAALTETGAELLSGVTQRGPA
jgi:hypothetical protein